MAADDDDRPPILGSWSRMYVLVLATLAAVIAAGTFVSWWYR
jgi:hypothetical protein